MSRRFARPYAQALLAHLADDGQARSARDDVARFNEALEQVPDLGRMATSPAVPAAAKQSIVAAVCDQLEVGRPARRLLTLLTKNYRLGGLGHVLAALDDELNRRLGIVVADVTSARPLHDDQRRRLEAVLAKALDRKIDLNLKTDPKLLAGFVAHIGSHRYDASLSGQLGRLTTRLTRDN